MCNASVGHMVRLYLQAWRAWSIDVSSTVRNSVLQMKRERWLPAKVQRLNALSLRKTTQYEVIDLHWKELIRYLAETQPQAFASHLRHVSQNRGQYQSIAESSFAEMSVLSRKSGPELRQTLLRTKAFISLLRATGMRGNTAVALTMDQFSAVENGGVLIHRLEKKSGSVRNIERPVWVCLYPHANPALDPLVHMAEYVHFVREDAVFTQGFKPRTGQCEVSFKTMVQRRFISVLHAVAIAIGIPDAFVEKKLHSFRVLCTNIMDAKGATAAEREAHIGWTSTTQSKYYTSLKHRALNARTPFLLAERDGKADPPHPMWALLHEVPLSAGTSFWAKVRYLAGAANVIAGVDVDSAFVERMTEHLMQEPRTTAPDAKVLAKRVRELERELTEVKRVKPTNATDDGTGRLKTLVATLKEKATTPDFPALCAQALPQFASLIDAVNTRDGFGLPQSKPEGKVLVRLLVIAGTAQRFGVASLDRGPHKSWLGWVRAVRKSHPLTLQVDTKSWSAFKASVGL